MFASYQGCKGSSEGGREDSSKIGMVPAWQDIAFALPRSCSSQRVDGGVEGDTTAAEET